MPDRCPHGERPDLPVARYLEERAAARGVAGPAPRHHLAGRRGRMATPQDPAGQLPALVLGRVQATQHGRSRSRPTAACRSRPAGSIHPGPFRSIRRTTTPSTADRSRSGISGFVPVQPGLLLQGRDLRGDYENVQVDQDGNVWAMWTDARNGRSSRTQTGRNPACEQSDAWADRYSQHSDAHGAESTPARRTRPVRTSPPCPTDATRSVLVGSQRAAHQGGPLYLLRALRRCQRVERSGGTSRGECS